MKYDFGGYATKYNIKCADGRTIRPGAFADCDGTEIPLVYQHVHTNPMNVLGHAMLENRADGVYAYCSFNDTEAGKHTKEVVKHGDVKCLSIYANRLKQQGSDVLHGLINEVSIVLKGANPGATIENVSFAHADGFEYESDDDVILTSGDPVEYVKHSEEVIEHSEESSSENQNGSSDGDSSDDETIGDIIDSMSDKKRAAFDFCIAVAMDGGIDEEDINVNVQHADDSDDETLQDIIDTFTEKEKMALDYTLGKIVEDEEDEEVDVEIDEEIEHFYEGKDSFMYKNVFNQNDTAAPTLDITNSDIEHIVESAKRGANGGSLKDTLCHFITENFDVPEDASEEEILQHGIESLDILFPEAKLGSENPELISRPMDWVDEVWNATKKSPFARVKSIAADITADEARARGYIKGNQKKEEVVKLLKRKITPQTVYKLQKLDRDDVIDATDLDVVAWLKREMRMMLNEELSRAILIGDGRDESDESKISEDNIKPIYHDEDLYTIKANVTFTDGMDRLEMSDAIVDAAIIARKDYMGSGSPVMYASTDTINMMLLARDKVGHRLYKTITELADACRVSKIVEVPIIETATRETEDGNIKKLLALIVNLKDYTVGADRGGEVNLFDDFDINYNKYEYLIEARCSGALTKPYSAIALEVDDSDVPNIPVGPGESDNDQIAG